MGLTSLLCREVNTSDKSYCEFSFWERICQAVVTTVWLTISAAAVSGWPGKILNRKIFIDFKWMRAPVCVRDEVVPLKTQCELQHILEFYTIRKWFKEASPIIWQWCMLSCMFIPCIDMQMMYTYSLVNKLSLMSNRKHIGANVYILLIPCAYLSPSPPYLPSHDALDALNVFVV